ncbi:MAG: hypothetical protein R3342_03600 [Lutibacter sp.]|uniref:hypothetical protein n=1 Tax=Lutibacter sp. TaxID=1925666 RepID=UPI00299DF689|nr:hypothetical protein [Lutibacter sp.]MDX1828612.1 hypothetical protein [Lutibacter sp.]
MLASLIAVISVVIGIFGANLFGFVLKKYSFGFTGNSIIGVFGSVFFIKLIGRFGFDPIAISGNGNINYTLLTFNLIISFFGAIVGLILLKAISTKLNKFKNQKGNN